MTERVEAAFEREQLAKLLALAQGAVLVGGQAVAFWASFFDVPLPAVLGAYVTKDSDFLGDRADVARIANGMRGAARYPHRRGLAALAGQVAIDLSATAFLNIDVLHRIVGFADAGALRRRAEERSLDGVRFRVMHPVDCLRSRIENLHKIAEKRSKSGVAQAELAVRIVKRYLGTVLQADNEPLALRAIENVVKMAFGPAGRQAFGKFNVDVLEAIPVERISNRKFRDLRWPQIRTRAGARRRKKP